MEACLMKSKLFLILICLLLAGAMAAQAKELGC